MSELGLILSSVLFEGEEMRAGISFLWKFPVFGKGLGRVRINGAQPGPAAPQENSFSQFPRTPEL